jgi:hypothetical protein
MTIKTAGLCMKMDNIHAIRFACYMSWKCGTNIQIGRRLRALRLHMLTGTQALVRMTADGKHVAPGNVGRSVTEEAVHGCRRSD